VLTVDILGSRRVRASSYRLLTCEARLNMDRALVAAQLERMSRSEAFAQAGRMIALLRYLVEKTLTGTADRLNQHAIAIDVFGRSEEFDPATDAIVRVESGRLREKLREYYATEGSADPIVIHVPKGRYAPHIQRREGLAYRSPRPMPTQDIRYCRTPDGIALAYSTVGNGYPLVMVPHWMSHLEADFRNPLTRHYWVEFSQRYRLIRFDTRGCGLSDRTVPDFPFDALVTDLATVIDALGLTRFALLGPSGGASVAVAYAARRPERVSHLMLLGGFIRGPRRTGDPAAAAFADAIDVLIRVGWGQSSSRFRNVFCSMLVPDGTQEQYKWMDDAQLAASSGENAERYFKILSNVDLSSEAAEVTVPTLVFHGTGDTGVPFSEAQYTAACIPNARLVALPTQNHHLLPDEPAWPRFVEAMDEFVLGSFRPTFP
jgi:pimeloyl-ACP methyl ester carboxylesterase